MSYMKHSTELSVNPRLVLDGLPVWSDMIVSWAGIFLRGFKKVECLPCQRTNLLIVSWFNVILQCTIAPLCNPCKDG